MEKKINTGFGVDFEVLEIEGKKAVEFTNHLTKMKGFINADL